MKILMVVDHKIPTDIRVENEAESLAKAGHEVGILAIGDFTETKDVYHNGYTIHQVAVSKQYRNKMHGLAGMIPWMDWFISKHVDRIFKTKRYEAVHFHDLYTFGAARKLKKKYGVYCIGDMHENYVEVIKDYKWPRNFPNNLLVSFKKWERREKEWLPKMDRVMTVSQGILDRIILKGGKPENAFLLPNYLRLDLFDEFPVNDAILEKYSGSFSLIYVGGFIQNRGLEHVILGVTTLKEQIPNLKLILVGDGEMMPQLRQMVIENDLQEFVDFEGWKNQSEIKSYLLAANVGLVPFRKTPQTDNSSSNKLFQYMYYQLPVVATNCNSVQELVEAERCGIIYESENASQFADAVMKLYKNKDEAAEYGDNGKQAVELKYNWEVATEKMINMYDYIEMNRKLGLNN